MSNLLTPVLAEGSPCSHWVWWAWIWQVLLESPHCNRPEVQGAPCRWFTYGWNTLWIDIFDLRFKFSRSIWSVEGQPMGEVLPLTPYSHLLAQPELIANYYHRFDFDGKLEIPVLTRARTQTLRRQIERISQEPPCKPHHMLTEDLHILQRSGHVRT